jgi:hypothetical protein
MGIGGGHFGGGEDLVHPATIRREQKPDKAPDLTIL